MNNTAQVGGKAGTGPVLSGAHSALQSGFSERPWAGSSQPLAGFCSTLVLISLRWHGGEVDLIIVMVAGGSQWLQTSATAFHIRVLRRLGYSSRLTTGLPRALVLFSPKSTTASPGFLSNQNHMRCKFTGKLRSPFGSGSKTFSQRTTRWNGKWTVAAAAAAAPPRDGLCVYDRRVPAYIHTFSVLLCFLFFFFPAELLLAAWQRFLLWIQFGACCCLTQAGCYLCIRERAVWKQCRRGKKKRSLVSL